MTRPGLLSVLKKEMGRPLGCATSGCTLITAPFGVVSALPIISNVLQKLKPNRVVERVQTDASRSPAESSPPSGRSLTIIGQSIRTDVDPFAGLRGFILARIAATMSQISLGETKDEALDELEIQLNVLRAGPHYELATEDDRRLLDKMIATIDRHRHVARRPSLLTHAEYLFVADPFLPQDTSERSLPPLDDADALLVGLADAALGERPRLKNSLSDREFARRVLTVSSSMCRYTKGPVAEDYSLDAYRGVLLLIREDRRFRDVSPGLKNRFEFGLRLASLVEISSGAPVGQDTWNMLDTYWRGLLELDVLSFPT